MPERVFVHIGLPKTGTTFVQNLLYANVTAFAAQGITVIGRHALHYEAASELANSKPAQRDELPTGRWKKVCKRVRDARTPTVVFSNERYSLARKRGVARIAQSFPGAELHVIITVRDFVAAEPSAWQEYVKNGGTRSWSEFCADNVARPGRFRKRRRIRRVLKLWSRHLPPDRMHVVTVPPPGSPRELIFERFCSVIGADVAALTTLEPERRNTSLDFVATELLRRLNARDPGLPVKAQRAEIKQWLANGALSRRPSAPRPVLEGEALALAREENRWLVRRLRKGGFDVVGRLADLRYASQPTPEAASRDDEAPAAAAGAQEPPAAEQGAAESTYVVDPAELVEVSLEAIELLAERSYERGRELRRRRKSLKDRLAL